jgi:tetratricopeptide (TPR) repeat protein
LEQPAVVTNQHREPDEVAVAEAQLQLALARGDWAAMRRAAEQLIGYRVRPTAHDFLALATACRNLGDIVTAGDAANHACECDPDLPEAIMTSALVAYQRGNNELALARYRTLADRAPDNSRWVCETVRLLEMLGRVDEAVDEMNRALRRMPVDPLLWNIAVDSDFRTLQDAARAGLPEVGYGLYARLAARAPSDDQLLRPPMSDEKIRDVIVAPPSSGSALVVIFTATNDTLGMPLPIFDRYLASLGFGAVYLKDFERLLYLRGVRSLGDETATLEAIRQLKRQLGAARLCTIGASDGGFAAIRYGVALDADRIMSFGGPTHWAPDLDEYAVMRQRHATYLSEQAIDLRAFLGARPYASRICLFYGEDAPRDRAHARYLDGLPGVLQHPVPELGDHQCLRWYALNRDLRTLLGEWLGGATARAI